MGLYLVSKLENKKRAMDAARQMEYTKGTNLTVPIKGK